MDTPIEIQILLNELAHRTARRILERARQVVSAANISASKELLNSLKIEVREATATTQPVITLTYADHGRFIDYKNPVWNKLAEIAKLEKWVRARGVSSFRYVSGIGNSSNLSEEQKVTKIAKGVAWSQRRHMVKWKPKAWKKKTLVKLLQELNEETKVLWQNGIALKVEQELATN